VQDHQLRERVMLREVPLYKPIIAAINGVCVGLGAELIQATDLRPGSYDPHARLQDMDSEGIDVSVLFPSIAIGFVAIKDAELSAAA